MIFVYRCKVLGLDLEFQCNFDHNPQAGDHVEHMGVSYRVENVERARVLAYTPVLYLRKIEEGERV